MSSRQKIEEAKYSSPINNPCVKEKDLSLKCLDDNNYDRTKCTQYFENYNNCVKFWNDVQAARSREGIRPHLPPPEDREKIKREYLEKKMGK